MFKSKLFKYIDKADHSEKMTPEMIKRIVGGKESLYALSKELGCSYSYLRLIKQGKIYKAQVAEALKELGLESAEIHSHDTKLPSEHKAPTANTPFAFAHKLNLRQMWDAWNKTPNGIILDNFVAKMPFSEKCPHFNENELFSAQISEFQNHHKGESVDKKFTTFSQVATDKDIIVEQWAEEHKELKFTIATKVTLKLSASVQSQRHILSHKYASGVKSFTKTLKKDLRVPMHKIGFKPISETLK